MKKAKTVDDFFDKLENWKEEVLILRRILLDTNLEETLKWGVPTYTYRNKNVVGLGSFKTYFGLWFFQGALLEDKGGHLINAQEGKTHALRQWRFSDAGEIDQDQIKSYVFEAMQNQEKGLEIKPDRKKPLVIPPEINSAFEMDPTLQSAFESLTLSKKREYAEYIEEAKREATRATRLEKVIPMIKAGKGLHDKYK